MVKWSYKHVHGHLDDNSSFECLTIPQQLNVIADSLAKEALQEANMSHKFTKSVYPGERTTIRIGGEKVMSSIKASLYQNWGREIAKKLYADKDLIPIDSFELVHWEALNDAMSGLP